MGESDAVRGLAEWGNETRLPARPSRLLAARRAAGLVLTTTRLIVEGTIEQGAPARVVARRAQRTAQRLLAIHGVAVRWSGSRPASPAIVVTNHVSYLDPLVVSAALPCISIAKGEAEGWPLIGAGLRALGVVFVRRGDCYSGARALLGAWRALDEGAVVLNFPEGTTSDGRDLGPFHRGIFGLAQLAAAPVVPTYIAYDDERVCWFGGQTFAPHYWRLSRDASRISAVVHFGKPMHVDPAEDPRDVAARMRGVVGSLRPAGRE